MCRGFNKLFDSPGNYARKRILPLHQKNNISLERSTDGWITYKGELDELKNVQIKYMAISKI